MTAEFFLVLYLAISSGVSVTTIPSPYPTAAACDEAGKQWMTEMSQRRYACVQGPAKMLCAQSIGGGAVISVPCGAGR